MKKYQIIYADPSWEYEDKKNCDPAMGGCTYQTMPTQQICDLPIGQLADKDCALFLWTTMPFLPDALQVIKARGFKYRTCAFTWLKINRKGGVIVWEKDMLLKGGIYSGLGHWTNGNHELCLFAKKGRPKRVCKCVKQPIVAPVGQHSAKPPETRDRIVQLMGDLPRVELFARGTVPEGWDAWGDEAEGENVIELEDCHV